MPHRWPLFALLVVSIFINYMDRSSLSLAATNLGSELMLRPAAIGLLLGAFFWTYASFQFLAGWLVDRYNVYLIYGFAFLLWSAATAFTGFASTFAMLFALRLVLGAGESIAYPAYAKIICRDYPARHLGLLNASIDAGAKCGPAIGMIVGGLIVAWFGWRSMFFILGFGAMIWLVPWFALVPRGKAVQAAAQNAPAGPGFLEIARRRDAWGSFLILFCANYAWYFIITWLPPYLEMERHFSKTMMAVYGSIPYWGIALTSLSGGFLSDRLIIRGGDVTRVRKTFAAGGLLLTTLILPACMVSDHILAMILLTAGCLSYGLFTSNCWTITQTLAGPSAAGKWTGMQNALGNIAGVVAPWLTGLVVERTGRFFFAFALVSFWMIVGALSCVFLLGKLEPVKWREVR